VTETIDAEATEELVVRPEAPPPTLFGTDNPDLVLAKASGIAKVLHDVVVKQGMSVKIGSSPRPYLKVEAWTTCGAMMGLFPKVEYSRPGTFTYIDPKTNEPVQYSGWEAGVVVVNTQGVELGRAEAQCTRGESNWKNRDDFALRSMAQTRAMGKALRMPLGWIAVLAGYEATPAEEMPAPAVADDDVPFDDTGGAQGQTADGTKAHGNTGTGAASTPPPAMSRAEANEVRRFALTERLHELCKTLGKSEDETSKLIAKDRLKNENKLPSHLSWLEKQLDAAEAAVAQQEFKV
jgi:hypothetical protein